VTTRGVVVCCHTFYLDSSAIMMPAGSEATKRGICMTAAGTNIPPVSLGRVGVYRRMLGVPDRRTNWCGFGVYRLVTPRWQAVDDAQN
jgi:hypothetical protein